MSSTQAKPIKNDLIAWIRYFSIVEKKVESQQPLLLATHTKTHTHHTCTLLRSRYIIYFTHVHYYKVGTLYTTLNTIVVYLKKHAERQTKKMKWSAHIFSAHPKTTIIQHEFDSSITEYFPIFPHRVLRRVGIIVRLRVRVKKVGYGWVSSLLFRGFLECWRCHRYFVNCFESISTYREI